MAKSIVEIFGTQLRMGGHRPALKSKRQGRWTTTTWDEWNRKSRSLAASLIAAGIQVGDRVAILSNTREEWVVADLAILMAGAVTVPVYPTLNAEETALIIENSGAKALLTEGPQHIEKLVHRDIIGSLHALQIAYIFDCLSLRDIPHNEMQRSMTCVEAAKMLPIPLRTLADAVTAGELLLDSPENVKGLDQRINEIKSDDLASLVYTAGAMGRPKGVMLTHGNFCFEARSAREGLNCTGIDEQLLFLPLAHIMGKLLFIVQMELGGVTVFAESMLRAIDNAAETNPSFFGSVPRVFEKFYTVVQRKASEEGRIKERIYHWAIEVGSRVAEFRRKSIPPSLPLMIEHRYADKLVLSKLRARFGSKLRFAVSGGAPLPRELGEWFDAIGITILEGYGLTESTGASNFNRPDKLKFGSVGPALPGVENAISSDGEVLIRGPNVMKGYWMDESSTAEVLDSHGFLHTGDIGQLDSQGMLTISDRKKDLIVTSVGKNIAPQNIENLIRKSPWVAHCMVVGEGKSHLTALITLNARMIRNWAQENGRPDQPSILAQDPEILALIQMDIDETNRKLSLFENIHRFAILPHDFSVTGNELTPTGKLRRSVIARRFADEISKLYEE